MITAYSQYAARRKPELIDETSFPLGGITPDGLDGGEFGAMVAEWDALEQRMRAVRARLLPDQLDAYDQLVDFPIAAMANLYRLYYGTAWNRLLAARNDARANFFADQVEAAFRRDGELTERYHRINDGKWAGMMAQVHMSYVIWNDPTQQTMPSIVRIGADTPSTRRHPQPRFVRPQPVPAGVIAIDATAFSRTQDRAGLRWTAVPHLGRTAGAVVALPQGRPATLPKDGARLDYDVTLNQGGRVTLTLYLAPTLDTLGRAGGRIGVSLDDGPIQVLQAQLEPTGGGEDTPAKKRWANAVSDNVVRLSADVGEAGAGRHVVKVWRVDDNMVLQKLVVSTVDPPASYLGPAPQRA
jgi:hypothetical protein